MNDAELIAVYEPYDPTGYPSVAGLRAVAAKAWAEAIQAAASARLAEVTFPLNATFDANPYKVRA